MNTVIIESIVSVAANLQISKTQKLNTINSAVGELTTAAEQTVMELQQTVVEGMKAAHADGKLTKDEIRVLGRKLLDGALQKMSDSGIEVLKAANVDVNAIIVGAGEALIARMKN